MCHLTCFRDQIVVNYKSLELRGEYRDGPLAWDCSADGSAGHFVGNRKYDKGVCVMANYFEMTRDELTAEKKALEEYSGANTSSGSALGEALGAALKNKE